MHAVDYGIITLYMLAVLAVGLHFLRRNENRDDYYVGGRSMTAGHLGLSIAATDVGGGFSIGLGGLGFVMGMSASWLLFTGLVGAWLAAVLIIPRVKKFDAHEKLLTYPDLLRRSFGGRVAMVAAIISGIGYLGFTGGQILAGAKLAASTIVPEQPFGMDGMFFSLLLMAGVMFLYTAAGGIKAVIYTDTVQWIILLGGLLFLGVPFAIMDLGGFAEIERQLPDRFFAFDNVSAVQLLNWFITIIPIWFVGMTLYQRLYAARDEREARRAWYFAGILEYPVIAFLGAFLGMVSRVYFPEAEPETGLPMLLKSTLPIGATGLVIASYFSAIMSTADSCLIASSGNFVNDIIERLKPDIPHQKMMWISRGVTLLIGIITFIIAASFETVLELILHAYAFMVSGLFVPTLAALFNVPSSRHAAMASMVLGGSTTLILLLTGVELPGGVVPTALGLLVSAATFLLINRLDRKNHSTTA
ncbi:MAG: sodium:solute symporter family protein [Bacteroidota bacterium]|nr:sodium:solute symporter family protein [Bacteroidota bacterium]